MINKKKVISGIFLLVLLLLPTNTLALTKKETVYTNLNYDGTTSKSVVNNHLFITSLGNTSDETTLRDILNINGKEKFTKDDNILTWECKGKDIFYQGITDKVLPISVNIKYYLNDLEMTADQMIGKKGTVKIVYEFTNNSYNEDEKLYTPFVVSLATYLNNKGNSNINITNGKVVDTGTRNMLVGLASPGLYEDIKLEEFRNLNKIVITYDTTKFSLNDVYMVITPKLLEETDFSIFDKVGGLNSSINSLQINMDKIVDASKELVKGSNILKDGSQEISNNLRTVSDVVKQLQNGSVAMEDGLKLIIAKLNEANDMLNNSDLASSIGNLQNLKMQNDMTITNLANTNESLKEVYFNNNLSLSEDELIANFIALGLDQDAINNLITCKRTYEGNTNLIALLNANNMALNSTITSLTDISNNINLLLTEFNKALGEVEVGASKLSSGLGKLQVGLNKLYDGSLTLTSGVSEVSNGLNTLTGGISKINKEGINKLTNYSNIASSYSNKAKKLVKLSNEYSGYASSNATSTIFIYKVQSVR